MFKKGGGSVSIMDNNPHGDRKNGPSPDLAIRRRILGVLSTERPKSIGEIAKDARTTRTTALKHLDALKGLGKAEELYSNVNIRLFTLTRRKKQ